MALEVIGGRVVEVQGNGAKTAPSELITSKELAAKLGVKPSAVRRWKMSGLMADGSTNINGTDADLWDVERVRKWLAGTVKAGQGAGPSTGNKPIKIGKRDLDKANGDFDSVIRRARVIEQRTFARLQDAMAGNDALTITTAERAYRTAQETLRKLELSAEEILKAQGKMIDRLEAQLEISRIGVAVKQDMLSIPSKVAQQLENKSAVAIETLPASQRLTQHLPLKRGNVFVIAC